MKKAICTINEGVYEATSFEQDKDFDYIRISMICPECKEPAFYRGITQNGREACFGAKHKDGCTLASIDQDDQGVQSCNTVTSQRIAVDFTSGGTGIGVDQLLRSLIESEEFRNSTGIIEVPEHGEYAISDFFVNFKDVTDMHLGSFHGFWGEVKFAKADQNETLWFNTGAPTSPSVNVDKKHREAIYKSFSINDEAEISGAYILVFGEMQKGKNTDKKFVLVTDPNNLTIMLSDKCRSELKTATKKHTDNTSQKQNLSASLEAIMELTFLLKDSLYKNIQSSNQERKVMDLQLTQIYNLAFNASTR